jgi:fatty acid desaturase
VIILDWPASGRVPTLDVPPLSELDKKLCATSRTRRLWTLSRPLIWTGLFFVLAHHRWWVPAVAVFAPLFLSQVVALNDVMHGSIGLGTTATELAAASLGALVLESGHAIRITHLAHHQQGGGRDDPESYVDLLPLQRLILELPLYRCRIWAYGWHHGTRRERAWVASETFAIALVARWCVSGQAPASVTAFVVLSVLAGWAFPIVSAMGPHADWGRDNSSHAYRVRGRWLPRLMLNLPLHLEHHLFPDVPSHRLPELAEALDPFLAAAVKEVRVW